VTKSQFIKNLLLANVVLIVASALVLTAVWTIADNTDGQVLGRFSSANSGQDQQLSQVTVPLELIDNPLFAAVTRGGQIKLLSFQNYTEYKTRFGFAQANLPLPASTQMARLTTEEFAYIERRIEGDSLQVHHIIGTTRKLYQTTGRLRSVYGQGRGYVYAMVENTGVGQLDSYKLLKIDKQGIVEVLGTVQTNGDEYIWGLQGNVMVFKSLKGECFVAKESEDGQTNGQISGSQPAKLKKVECPGLYTTTSGKYRVYEVFRPAPVSFPGGLPDVDAYITIAGTEAGAEAVGNAANATVGDVPRSVAIPGQPTVVYTAPKNHRLTALTGTIFLEEDQQSRYKRLVSLTETADNMGTIGATNAQPQPAFSYIQLPLVDSVELVGRHEGADILKLTDIQRGQSELYSLQQGQLTRLPLPVCELGYSCDLFVIN
jgi:hypothetical protein